jgi:hypothetical protein
MARGSPSKKRSDARASDTPRSGPSSRRVRASAKPRRRLTELVSALTKRVVSAAKPRSKKPRASSTPSKPSGASKPAAFVPVTRRSVVRKPAREPSIRVRKPAAGASTAPVERREKTRPAKAAPGRLSRERIAAIRESAPPDSSGLPDGSAAESPELDTARIPGPAPEQVYSFPAGYGDTRIVLLVKDPWWVYAYWEVRPEDERAARSQLTPDEVLGLQTVLRVHDVTGVNFPESPANRSFDIPLSGLANNWYLHVDAPDRSFVVDIGLLTSQGRFLLLARSNTVTTPRAGPSDLIDDAWAIDDDAFWKLFGSAVIGTGSSPAHWLPVPSSAHAWLGAGATGARPPVQGFWCRVDTDLVIHGATEPKARVSIQGRPVPVRSDGTFTLRFAVPRGVQTLTIDVVSADGATTRSITPTVTLAWSGMLSPDREPSRPGKV